MGDENDGVIVDDWVRMAPREFRFVLDVTKELAE